MTAKGKLITDPRGSAPRAAAGGRISPSQLRAEGVLDVGLAVGSVLYVRTRVKLHLFRGPDLAERDLDDYGSERAIYLLEEGFTANDVTQFYGISFRTLALALKSRGYERLSLDDVGPRKGSSFRLREKKRRRGRQLRRNATDIYRNTYVPRGAGKQMA